MLYTEGAFANRIAFIYFPATFMRTRLQRRSSNIGIGLPIHSSANQLISPMHK